MFVLKLSGIQNILSVKAFFCAFIIDKKQTFYISYKQVHSKNIYPSTSGYLFRKF